MSEDNQEPENVVLTATGFSRLKFAEHWFRDALTEARTRPPSRDAKRREIVFAGCCLESYLVEWVIEIIPSPHETVGEFFIKEDRYLSLANRYVKAAERLKSRDLIPRQPEFNDELDSLSLFRNALVHGNVSWPIEPSMKVSPQDLDAKGPGWAIGIVIERIRCLHKADDADPPEWLIDP